MSSSNCLRYFVFFFLATLPCSSHGEEQKNSPWWQIETKLDKDGKLLLTSKAWWKQAQSLKVGEHFAIESELPNGGRMLVRRDRLKCRKGRIREAIVWILDDDGDMLPSATNGDTDSDCYVVDYGADGRADRMVDYMDNDADGKPDEMDIRYFYKGQLRIAWFGADLDGDGQMYDLAGYEYSGNFFLSDPHGDNLVYANHYDPQRRTWVPIGECPFAFCDTDNDGYSEAVVRVSAVPLDFDPKNEIDPGNSLFKEKIPFQQRMRKPGVVNVRYSIDLDGLSGKERPLHYDLGFNMIGSVPYQFDKMARHNPLRREPQTTIVIPHRAARRLAETYPAEQTGMSWHEYGDDAVTLGHGPHANEDRRWEGVFWMWDRRFMHNTGNPTQLWNMRREFCPTPSKKRELYYCRADRRIHLKGATDGWIQIGHLGDPKTAWGEIRMFDTDGDGYFDRWETYRSGQSRPVRVSTVLDPGVEDLPNDWEALQKIFTKKILPKAIAANEKLMAAMRLLDNEFRVPDDLARALEAAGSDSERRYVQDVIRETQYLALRDKLLAANEKAFADAPVDTGKNRKTRIALTTDAWEQAHTLTCLDTAYAAGRYDEAAQILNRMAKGK